MLPHHTAVHILSSPLLIIQTLLIPARVSPNRQIDRKHTWKRELTQNQFWMRPPLFYLQPEGGMGLKYRAEDGKTICYDYMPGSAPTVMMPFLAHLFCLCKARFWELIQLTREPANRLCTCLDWTRLAVTSRYEDMPEALRSMNEGLRVSYSRRHGFPFRI